MKLANDALTAAGSWGCARAAWIKGLQGPRHPQLQHEVVDEAAGITKQQSLERARLQGGLVNLFERLDRGVGRRGITRVKRAPAGHDRLAVPRQQVVGEGYVIVARAAQALRAAGKGEGVRQLNAMGLCIA